MKRLLTLGHHLTALLLGLLLVLSLYTVITLHKMQGKMEQRLDDLEEQNEQLGWETEEVGEQLRKRLPKMPK